MQPPFRILVADDHAIVRQGLKLLIDSQADANFWDPSKQLRVVKKKGKVPPYPEPEPAGWGD